MIPKRLKTKLDKYVDKFYQRADEIFERPLKRPFIRYDLDGQIAGMALYDIWAVRVNCFCYENNIDDYLKNVVGHEIAHLIAYEVFRESGHGKKWKDVMVKLGLKPEVCHNYKTKPARKTQKFLYSCDCKDGIINV